MTKPLPRGIDPDLLLSQIRNTMPYVFETTSKATDLPSDFPPANFVRNFAKNLGRSENTRLSHAEYFRLCVSAHYLTCATPVPTDVDNQIRLKLWHPDLPADEALEMAKLVLESRNWDFSPVTRRISHGLSGHRGEWFTLACGAYCALSRYSDPELRRAREELFEGIAAETQFHSETFGRLMREKEGLDCLKTSSAIAHNFGDLDRVMDLWELAPFDPLRVRFYKLGAAPFDADRKLRFLGRLWIAGELYKSPIDPSSMAQENHRHLALRKPRCLRTSPALMIETGPFLGAWGTKVAEALRTPEGAPSEDTLEVVQSLKFGLTKLPGTVGYWRALRGIAQVHEDLDIGKHPTLRISDKAFERSWSDKALALIDDLPSRAR